MDFVNDRKVTLETDFLILFFGQFTFFVEATGLLKFFLINLF